VGVAIVDLCSLFCPSLLRDQGRGQQGMLMFCCCALTDLLASASVSLGCLTITPTGAVSSMKGVHLGTKRIRKQLLFSLRKLSK